MSAIVRKETRNNMAVEFVDRYAATNYLFVVYGKDTDWTTNEPDPDSVPSTSPDEETAFWTDAEIFKVVGSSYIREVAPRIDWTSGDTYVEFDTALADPWSTSFYVVSNVDLGGGSFEKRVYSCAVAGPGTSTDQPVHGTGTVAPGTDGYSWTYLYAISGAINEDLLTTDWIPLPSDGSQNDLFLPVHVMVAVDLGDLNTEFGTITSYRKIGLIENVLDDVASPLTADAGIAGTTSESGSMLYIDHRITTNRTTDTTIKTRIVLQF